MQIRTKLILFFIVFATGLGAITVLIRIESRNLKRELERVKIIESYAGKIYDINMLVTQMKPFNMERVSRQFGIAYSQGEKILNTFTALDETQKLGFQEGFSALQSLFHSIFRHIGGAENSEIYSKRKAMLLDQFQIQVRNVLQEVNSFSNRIYENIAQAQKRLNTAILILGLVIILIIGVAGVSMNRMLTHRLDLFTKASTAFSQGNLDFIIEEGADDELGRMARSLNFMTMQLKQIMVSKATLETSERKLKEALANAERSNKELEQFAYVASHDLQEPLRMVASFTQLLADRYRGKLDEKADTFINFAVEGAQRMKVLINDLLAYSRLETRSQPFSEVDCDKLIKEVIDGLTLQIKESQAEIILESPFPVLPGEASQLFQVFQNLLSNGIKFKSSLPPKIVISCQETPDHWEFHVSDNGLGIEPQYFDRIFIIFQRLHERGKYPGSGMGLAIVKKIIERHGGTIRVQSEPGGGSEFIFTVSNQKQGRT